jgi:hypothetical protein
MQEKTIEEKAKDMEALKEYAKRMFKIPSLVPKEKAAKK